MAVCIKNILTVTKWVRSHWNHGSSKDMPQEERRPGAKRIDGQWMTSCFLLLRWQKGRRGGRTTMHVIHLLPQLSITQTQGRIRAGHQINNWSIPGFVLNNVRSGWVFNLQSVQKTVWAAAWISLCMLLQSATATGASISIFKWKIKCEN